MCVCVLCVCVCVCVCACVHACICEYKGSICLLTEHTYVSTRKGLLHTSLPCSSPSCLLLLLLLRLGVPPVTCSAVPIQVGGCTLMVRWGGAYCRHFRLPSLIRIHSFCKSVNTCYCASARIERIRTVLYVAQQS